MKNNYKIISKTSRALILTSLSLILSLAVYGQVNTYQFAKSTGSYSAISGGTLLGTTSSDDGSFVNPLSPTTTATTGEGFPIGFNFTYNGEVFDRIGINNNGWIGFGKSADGTSAINMSSTSQYNPLPSTTAITPAYRRNRIAGMARDLQAQATASLRIETIGTAPNRTCVIQWTNYKRFGTTGTGDNLNFQIRLNETANSIQVVFGSVVWGTTVSTGNPAGSTSTTSTGAQSGLGGTVNTDFNARTTTTTTSNWNIDVTATHQGNSFSMGGGSNIPPVSGTTFTWTLPPPPCPPNGFLYSTVSLPANNAPVAFSTCNWAGDYNVINGAVAGQNLRIDQLNGPASWLVIRSGSPGGAVVAQGVPPLTFANTFTGSLYMHIYTSQGSCGTDNVCRDYTITCTSCPPANNTCATATAVTPVTVCNNLAGSNIGATPSGIAIPSCSGFTSGTANDVWYSFTANGVSPYTVSVTGTFDAVLAVYSNCSGSLISCVDATTSGGTETISLGVLPAGTYFYRVYGWAGATGTFTHCVTFVDPVCAATTAISSCGTNQTFTLNSTGVWNTSFCGWSVPGQEQVYSYTPAISGSYQIEVVSTDGVDFVDYAWKTGSCSNTGWTCLADVSLPGVIGTISMTAGTTYYILVDKENWSSTSPTTQTFRINCAVAAPANDLCQNVTPTVLASGGSIVFTGTTLGANPDGALTLGTVFHAVTLTASCNNLQVSYCNTVPNQTTVYQVISTACPVSATYPDPTYILASNAGSLFTCSSGNADIFYANLPAGTYYIPVAGAPSGPYSITVSNNPCLVNDACSGALPLPCNGTISGNTATATSETGLPVCGNYNKGIWYTVTSPGTGTMTLSLCGSSYDTYLSVFSGSSCGTLSCVVSNDDFCGLQSQVSFTATQGTTYYVLVAGFGSTSSGPFTLTSTCPPPCVSPPTGGTISGPLTGCTNQNLSYNLSGGNGSIQWQGATAIGGPYADLAGQTSATLTYSVPIGGTYYLRAKRSSPGCNDDFSNILTINITNGVSAFSVTSSATNVCPGEALQLGLSSSGPANMYTFTTATGVALENMTGATTIIGSLTDDGGSGSQTIPFAFSINGVNYTQFNASSNGLLNFGASGNSAFSNSFGSEVYYPALLPPWDDLHTGNNGNVRTKVVGPAGSRKFIIEWNIRRFSGDPTTDFTKTFQVWLYEGSNVIQYVYGNDAGAGFTSASVGFSTSATEIIHVNTSTHTASNTLPGNNLQTAWPGAGRSYIFSPPIPTGTIVWSSLNGFSASGFGPHVANPMENDTYTVLITASNGCTATGSVNVVVDPAPVPSFSANAPAVCEGSQIDLYALDGDQYTFSGPGFGPITLPGDPFNGSTINVTFNAQPGVHDGNYNVTVTNSYGCSTTETVYIGVNPLPQLTIDNIVPESCPGAMDGSFTLSASGTPDFTYYLTNGDQNGGGIFELLGTGDYYAYVSDANCFNFTQIQVTVPLVPNVPPTLTCPGAINVNNDAGVCGASVLYADPVAFDTCPNGMSTVIQTNGLPSGSVFPVGTTVNSFVVYDAEGDSATCSFSVTVADVEDPVITNVPANFSSCNPVSWTPPTATDNCSSGSSLVVTSNYQPGDMFPFGTTEVIYTATDAYNNQTTVSFFVTRLEDSYAADSISSNRDYNNICIGENITLTLHGGSLGEAAQWLWYAGGCGTGTPVGTGTSITVAPSVTTTYYVRAQGFCNTTACVQLTVVVSTAPPATAPTYTSVPAYGAPGVTNTITVAPVSGATYYRWSTNNGQINGILFNGDISPEETTIPQVDVTYVLPQQNYQIRVLAGNACGRTNTANNHIRGTVAATTCINGPTNVCPSATYSYSACPIASQSGNSSVSYQWSLIPTSAGTITGNGNINVTVTLNPGFTSAQLCVSGVSAFGLAGPSYCITLNSAAPAPASVSGAALVCADGTTLVTYTAAPVASAVSYSWTVPAGASIVGAANGTSIDVIFGPSFTGGNVCVAAVTAACGTSTFTCMSVAANVVGDPGVIVGPSSGVCGESNVSYSLSNGGANTYNWTLPAGASFNGPANGSAISVDFGAGFTSGYITVEAVFTCGSVTRDIFVNGAPAMPTVNPATICANTTVTYVANSTGATSYNWAVFGANTSSVNFSTEAMTAEWGAANNSFTVTATNACGTSDPFALAQNCRLATAGNMGQVNVFPNPTTGLIAVEFTAETAAQYNITVTDLSGRSVLATDLKAVTGTNHTVIDLSFVNKGLYMLYLRDAAGNASITRVAVE